jgi:tetratricopeptide (TPR) repeat protein
VGGVADVSPGPESPPRAVYVGVGIGTYDDASFQVLPRAVADVQDVGDVLSTYGYEELILPDPDEEEIRPRLRELLPKDSFPAGGSLIVLWAGHGMPSPEHRLRLIAHNTVASDEPNITPQVVAGIAARSGANQILLLFDTCYSEQGAIPAVIDADEVLQQIPPEAEPVWIGVVASALSQERAVDGAFGERLLSILSSGPTDAELQRRWSVHNAQVTGEDLIAALQKGWDEEEQRLKAVKIGEVAAMFVLPNPLHDPDAPEQVAEQLLLAARGGDTGDVRSYFVGRADAMNRLADWIGGNGPGLLIVTGPPGSGKSALLGRVVSLSDPIERARLEAQGGIEPPDPGKGSIHAHVLTRGLNADRLAEVIDAQLCRRGLLEPGSGGPRNRGELLGALQRSGRCPMIVVDGLDEAGTEAWRIADEVLRPLAGVARILVGTRDLRPLAQGEPSLIGRLAGGELLDLGTDDLRAQTVLDVAAYVALRLEGKAGMDAAMVADAVVRLSQESNEGIFLLARVLTSQLRVEPIDTSTPGWEGSLATSVEDAFERDLDAIEVLARPEPVPQAARDLLRALAWGYGAGLPADLWPVAAGALSENGIVYTRSDVFWILGQSGRYIVEGGEAGRAVYRLSHQRLVQYLRPPGDLTRDLDDPDGSAAALARALVDTYLALLRAGQSPREPGYLWYYAWRHAADAGWAGIADLRRLVEADREAFIPDLALALTYLSERYWEIGRPLEGIPAATEAVDIYVGLARDDPAVLPQLAAALSDLGLCHVNTTRAPEGIEPLGQAIEILRELVATDRAAKSSLALALTNLGGCLASAGRAADGIDCLREAVGILRELVPTNPAAVPSLALALNNLGLCYTHSGRPQEGVEPLEESVQSLRELAPANAAVLPGLAQSLTNLGLCLTTLGRMAAAVEPLEAALELLSSLDPTPAVLSNAAMARTFLGVCYSSGGRAREGIELLTQARQSAEELALTNDAMIPTFVLALTNLGGVYLNTGQSQDGIAPLEDAIGRLRGLVETNAPLIQTLALALANLGACFLNTGRPGEAIDKLEESVRLLRELTSGTAAVLPSLAMAVGNLGGCYLNMGRSAEGAELLEEAVESFGRLPPDDLDSRVGLALALTNLGACYLNSNRAEASISALEESVRLHEELLPLNPILPLNLALTRTSLGASYLNTGRPSDAMPPLEEAVRYLRDAVARSPGGDNPAVRSSLALALANLGACIQNTEGSGREAIITLEEAIAGLREFAPASPAMLMNLALALGNLGACLAGAGDPAEGIPALEESVSTLRDLSLKNPRLIANIAKTLGILESCYRRVGRDEDIEAAWTAPFEDEEHVQARAVLSMYRSETRGDDELAAVHDLARAEALMAGDMSEARYHVHAMCRSRRADRPAEFDRRWQEASGERPAPWLRLPAEDLEAVRLWVATPTRAAERDYLLAHPDLVDAESTTMALDELELLVGEQGSTAHYREMVARAKVDGIEAAYRMSLVDELLAQWVASDIEASKEFLTERNSELLAATAVQRMATWVQDYPEVPEVAWHGALLALASRGLESKALDALATPGSFPGLLDDLTRSGDIEALADAATLAETFANEHDLARAAARFARGIALAVRGNPGEATELVALAGREAPAAIPGWLALLVEIVPRFPAVASLSAALVRRGDSD